MKRKILPPELKRIHVVKVRLNEMEKRKLDRITMESRTHAPDIFRSLLMKNKIPKPLAPILDIQTYYQIRKIGANFNQYVKTLHQGRLTELDAKIRLELSDLIQIVRHQISSK